MTLDCVPESPTYSSSIDVAGRCSKSRSTRIPRSNRTKTGTSITSTVCLSLLSFTQPSNGTFFVHFNRHYNLEGTHAFLSASKYHWIDDADEKFEFRYRNARATQRGTQMHEFAKQAIALGVRLPDIPQTINQYVNDAIGFGMQPEVILFYSFNCYGTADTIGFKKKQMSLRIHDFKSGVVRSSEKQLYVYAALFCLEYDYKPHELKEIKLRIYQLNEFREYDADPVYIAYIMDRIVTFDKRIEAWKAEEA